jgi:AcrR family transcriptional regulator
MRSDAVHNRKLLIDAAEHVFAERGIDVPVAEIASEAGVGRATLFRNFPTKDDLIVAIVTRHMDETLEDGRALLEGDEDDADAAFSFIEDVVSRQVANRALLEAASEQFLLRHEIQGRHAELVQILDGLLDRGKRAGAVRPEVVALDVLLLVKGVCMQPEAAYQRGSSTALMRHLDLVRAAITTPEHSRPLRGEAPTLADFEQGMQAVAAAATKQRGRH